MKRSNTRLQNRARKVFMEIVGFLPIEVIENDTQFSKVLEIIKSYTGNEDSNYHMDLDEFHSFIQIYGHFDGCWRIMTLNREKAHQVNYQYHEDNNSESCYYNMAKHNVLKYHEIEESNVVNASLSTIDLNGNIIRCIRVVDDKEIFTDIYNPNEPYNLESSYVEDYGHQKVYHK
jgi:hypothetical protein